MAYFPDSTIHCERCKADCWDYWRENGTNLLICTWCAFQSKFGIRTY